MSSRSVPPRHARRLRATVALLAAGAVGVTAPALTGTGRAEERDADGKVQVVAAFYPLEYLARTIGGDHVDVTGLTAPGVEPHDLELSPKQVAAVGEADLVVHLKGFQPAVDTAVEQAAPGHVAEASHYSPLVEHTGAEEDDGHAHAHEGADPHLWLDPTRYALVADGVADQLTAADPAHGAEYRANAAALTGKLKTLDADYRAGLEHCTNQTFLTSHAAFGYLADAYGLHQLSVSGLDPEAEPSAARLAAIKQEATEHGVTTVFTETLASPKLAETLARELGLRTAVLDPIEGVSRDNDYFSVMRANLAALQDALGCAK
ncbi:metal ABC transporter solute-binding protein, Zn/Mn family [Streptacidiphilus jiangxiensis]|uniref:Zinc transport system substrate-binding protein n=1 Tax=Streptacidiphilus jiangxiensis TaxID=235985 RepID=A0A1H7W309_STRJI|nr:metal ABC transporter substrate-binding protein [Streptacidiphilus jiangxiensis]SEM15883.1 zinc transport system substrate-binding protein [Streptacidiphilus jiangxiensis]